MSKFTPGPWEACNAQQGKCTCGQVWSIPGDFPVCTAREPRRPLAAAHQHMADAPDMIYQSITPEECRANALLIAAAPTMFSLIEKKAAEGDADAKAFMENFKADGETKTHEGVGQILDCIYTWDETR